MSWITDIGTAVATVVRGFQLRRREPELVRQHFWAQDGHCLYCGVAQTVQNEGGRCPKST